MNFKKSLLPLSIALVLSGCGTKEEEVGSTPNSAPILQIANNSISVDENSDVLIGFNVIDADNDPITISVRLEPEIGSFLLEDNSVIYTPENVSSSTPVFSVQLSASAGSDSTI